MRKIKFSKIFPGDYKKLSRSELIELCRNITEHDSLDPVDKYKSSLRKTIEGLRKMYISNSSISEDLTTDQGIIKQATKDIDANILAMAQTEARNKAIDDVLALLGEEGQDETK